METYLSALLRPSIAPRGQRNAPPRATGTLVRETSPERLLALGEDIKPLKEHPYMANF